MMFRPWLCIAYMAVTFVASTAAVGGYGDGETPFLPGVEVGIVSANPIREASGLAASRINPNVLYTHNDRGDVARIFAINTDGVFLGTVNLKFASNVDYEDISVGPGPDADASYIYVADTGNNFFERQPRDNIVIYRFLEPTITARNSVFEDQSTMIREIDVLTLYYPFAFVHDAETLLVDPTDGKLYIITKRNGDNYVYRTTEAWEAGNAEKTLEYTGRMGSPDDATGGDVSADGMEVLVKNRGNVVYFRRNSPSDDLASLLVQQGLFLPYETEPQGEAIAFSANGNGYYTISEAKRQSSVPLFYYARSGSDESAPTTQVPTIGPSRSPTQAPVNIPPNNLPGPYVTDVRVLRRRVWIQLSGDIDPEQAENIDNYAIFYEGKEISIKEATYLPSKSGSPLPRVRIVASLFTKNAILDVGISHNLVDTSMETTDVMPGYALIASVGSGKNLVISDTVGESYVLRIRGEGLINYVRRMTDGRTRLNVARTSKIPYESVLEGAVLRSRSEGGGEGVVIFDSMSVDRTVTSKLDPSQFAAGPLPSQAKERLYLRTNGTIADILL
mmetsp:Transcript_27099/g.59280  ORF Transcript_27099/g.59280 Transcript_27099/m.59280 type:complete len:561 (-) Transcript_27099:53-1735(-)